MIAIDCCSEKLLNVQMGWQNNSFREKHFNLFSIRTPFGPSETLSHIGHGYICFSKQEFGKYES